MITAGICDQRNRIQGSSCTAVIPNCQCPLWVKSGHWGTSEQCPLYPQKQTLELSRVMSALCQKQTYAVQQIAAYSITSSAVASSAGGTGTPRVFAHLRLSASTNLVGCSTGRSAGFVPFRILST